MNSKPAYARTELLGEYKESFSLTGDGSRVLLLDSGIESGLDFGGRLKNLARIQGEEEGSIPGNSHGLRGASIVGEGIEAKNLPGGSLGIAPKVEILSALYKPLTGIGLLQFYKKLFSEYGKIDVIGLPWSVQINYELRHNICDYFVKIANLGSLIIAAAGHDGATNIRFPAVCETVLCVGVYDDDLRSTAYCGTDPAQKKPELLVRNQEYCARTSEGLLGSLGGTSAAVGLVTGLAALWCENLRNQDIKVTPLILKVVLIGTSEPTSLPDHRIVSVGGALLGKIPFTVLQFNKKQLGFIGFRSINCSSKAKITVVTNMTMSTTFWIPKPPQIQLKITYSGQVVNIIENNWVVFEFEPVSDESFTLEIKVSGAADSMGIYTEGVHITEK